MQAPAVDYTFQYSPSMDTGFSGSYWSQDLNHNAVLDMSQESCTDRRLSPSQVGSAKASSQAVEIYEPGKQARTEQPRNEQGTTLGPQDTFPSRPEQGRQLFMECTESIPDRPEEDSSTVQYVAPEALSQRIATASDSSVSQPSSPSDIKHPLESPRESQDFPQTQDSANKTESVNEVDLVQESSEQDEQSTSGTSDPSVSSPTDVSSLLEDPEKLKQILEALQTKGVLRKHGYKKEDSPTPEIKVAESGASPRPEPQHACPSCPKSFGRRCELKYVGS
jgi:hypothetical protein